MNGHAEGGIKAAATNKARHGDDFYKKIGARGGRAKHTRPYGFQLMDKKRLRELASKGGKTTSTPLVQSDEQ